MSVKTEAIDLKDALLTIMYTQEALIKLLLKIRYSKRRKPIRTKYKNCALLGPSLGKTSLGIYLEGTTCF